MDSVDFVLQKHFPACLGIDPDIKEIKSQLNGFTRRMRRIDHLRMVSIPLTEGLPRMAGMTYLFNAC